MKREKSTLPPKKMEKTAGCCASLRAEINPCQPWFLVMDSSGYKIDIPESFAPSGRMTIIGKFIITSLALATLILGLVATTSVRFYFAYFTNVSLFLLVVYQLLSFLSSMFPSRIQQPRERVTGLAKWTWIFFVAGVHGQFMASLLYWLTVFVPHETEMTYLAVVPHGVVMFLSLIDGLVLNRIPLRLSHWWGMILPVEVFYLIWTILHWKFDVGNPNEMDEDASTNDDAIYSVLVWGEDDWVSSTKLSILVVFVLGPLVYLYMWCISRYPFGCCTQWTRLYFLDANNKTARSKRRVGGDVEMGSHYRLHG